MLISGKKSSTSKGRHQRRDAGVLQVPAPNIPPGGDGDGFFSDKAWAGIANKLGLSQRQVEIARCVVADQKNQQIARRLDMSLNTVQTHMKRLHEKLAIKTRAGLVARIFSAHDEWRTESAPRQAVTGTGDLHHSKDVIGS